MRHGAIRLIVPWLALGAALCGDQVALENGDRLTGQIIKLDGEKLTLKSEFAGTVEIKWSAVTAITATQPIYFGLASGQVLLGSANAEDGKFQIKTADVGTVAAMKDQIKFIRSKEEQTAHEAEIERLRSPRLIDLWSGFVDTGLSLARGNAKTTNFNLGANAARTTRRDKIAVYFTSLYANSSALGKSQVTADAVRGGLRYDLNINPRTFAFGTNDYEFDKFQKLDLRAVFGGGFGYHAVKSESTTFDLFGGGSLNKEFYSTGLNRTSGEALFGDELSYKISKVTQLKERMVFFPNFTEAGEYRITFDASAVTALRKWLGWQVTLSDRFQSNPVPGTKKNDLLLTTGLRVTFGK